MSITDRVVNRTNHPHIVKVDGVCGGEAIVEGTRIAVWHIVNYYYTRGLPVEGILLELPTLTPAQIFDALAYYHDNMEEIDHIRYLNSYDRWRKQQTHAES